MAAAYTGSAWETPALQLTVLLADGLRTLSRARSLAMSGVTSDLARRIYHASQASRSGAAERDKKEAV